MSDRTVCVCGWSGGPGKAQTDEWRQFFNDVAKEIKDQAKYDVWMTFAILVGIAIATGFAGALLGPR